MVAFRVPSQNGRPSWLTRAAQSTGSRLRVVKNHLAKENVMTDTTSIWVGAQVGRQKFQRNRAIEHHVLGLVDHAHSTGPQLLQTIMRKGLARHAASLRQGSFNHFHPRCRVVYTQLPSFDPSR